MPPQLQFGIGGEGYDCIQALLLAKVERSYCPHSFPEAT